MLCTFRMHFYFRTEGGAYEIYENNMHTKYSGFTVLRESCTIMRSSPSNVRMSKQQKHVADLPSPAFFLARSATCFGRKLFVMGAIRKMAPVGVCGALLHTGPC